MLVTWDFQAGPFQQHQKSQISLPLFLTLVQVWCEPVRNIWHSVLWLWKKTRQDVLREGLIPCTEFQYGAIRKRCYPGKHLRSFIVTHLIQQVRCYHYCASGEPMRCMWCRESGSPPCRGFCVLCWVWQWTSQVSPVPLSRQRCVCYLWLERRKCPAHPPQSRTTKKTCWWVLLHVWEVRVIGNLEAFWENFFPFLLPFFHYIFT